MKIYFIEKIKQFSNQELALYLTCLAFFLPFHLFLSILTAYLVYLVWDGSFLSILKESFQARIILSFISLASLVSLYHHNWPGFWSCLFMLVFLIFFRSYQNIISPDFFHVLIQSILLLSFVAAGYAVIEHLQLFPKFNYEFLSPSFQRVHQNRSEVTFFNPNYYGIIACFCVMISLYFFFLTHSWKWKVLTLASIVANGLGISFTQSRTAFPAILVGIIIYLFMTMKSTKAIWLSLFFLSMGIMLLFSNDIGLRMSLLDESLDDRVLIWQAGLELFQQHPLLGQGPLTYLHAYKSIGAPYHEHAHSLYIDTLLSYGIIGSLVLMLSLLKPIKLLFRLSRNRQLRPIFGLICSFIAVVAVHGIFDLAIFWIQSAFLFFLITSSLPMWAGQNQISFPDQFRIH